MNKILTNKFLNVFQDEKLQKEFTFVFNVPLNISALKASLVNNGSLNKLPETYLDFLKITNGCILFNYLGHEIDGFHFLNIEEIVQETIILKEIYNDFWQENIIIFANILGVGDHLGFKVLENGQYQILDCFHEEIPTNWKVIGTSFDKFLEKLLDTNGEKYWLEENFTIAGL